MANHGIAYSLGQYNEVVYAILKSLPGVLAGTDPKQMIRRIQRSGEELADKLTEVLLTLETFVITTDGRKTASELARLTKQTFVSNWITDRDFPIKEHAVTNRTLEYVVFGERPKFEEVLEEFRRLNLVQPTYEEALCFSTCYPEEQKKYKIIFPHEPVICSDLPCVIVLQYFSSRDIAAVQIANLPTPAVYVGART